MKMQNNILEIFYIIWIAVGFIGSIICLYIADKKVQSCADDMKELEEENIKLKSEFNNLTYSYNHMSVEYNNLVKHCAELEEDNSQLEDNVSKLQEQKEVLLKQCGFSWE